MNELSVIKTHGHFVAQQIEQLSQTVLVNADDGVELSLLDIDQVEAVDKAIESTQNLTRACLYWMRQKQGWKLLGFDSFEDYGEKRFGYEKRYLNRLATAHEVQKSLGPIGPKEIPESQLRPLSPVPEEERQAIWDEANRKAEEAGKERTARMIEAAVEMWKQKAQQAEQEADELAGTLERTEQEMERIKADTVNRFKEMTQDLRRELKESAEMTKAVAEQRDRLLAVERKEKAMLKDLLDREQTERKAAIKAHQKALEEAKQAAEDVAVIARKAELDEIERRLAMTKERLAIKQAEVDRITHMNLLHNESDKAIQVIDQAIMTISIQLSSFLDTVHEYSGGDPAQIDIENWEKVVRNYNEGRGAMDEVLRILRKQTALPNLTAVKGGRDT